MLRARSRLVADRPTYEMVGDLHGLGQTAHRELNVNSDVHAGAERHAGLGDRVETRERGFHTIFADWHVGKRVEARFVRDGSPLDAGLVAHLTASCIRRKPRRRVSGIGKSWP
jgi:hypothetical protein